MDHLERLSDVAIEAKYQAAKELIQSFDEGMSIEPYEKGVMGREAFSVRTHIPDNFETSDFCATLGERFKGTVKFNQDRRPDGQFDCWTHIYLMVPAPPRPPPSHASARPHAAAYAPPYGGQAGPSVYMGGFLLAAELVLGGLLWQKLGMSGGV